MKRFEVVGVADGSFVIALLDDDNSQADGDQESIIARLERFGVNELHVILNFFEELKTRVGN